MKLTIQRDPECDILDRLWQSKKSEFLAVYGRRRVGKTYLIDRYFGRRSHYYSFTGQRNTPLQAQVKNFMRKLDEYFPGQAKEQCCSWNEVFDEIRKLVGPLLKQPEKVVIFLDELPWFCSRNSRFKEALEYFWNDWASKQDRVLLIICGSAASWMLENIVKEKGGLHNRVTQKIHLQPFSLGQAKVFLQRKGIELDNRQVLELYMVMGGIPFYLDRVEKGLSSTQIIDKLCFSPEGLLYDEFSNLYASLYEAPEMYISVVELLAKKRIGLTRTEIMKGARLSSGGTLTKVLRSLDECGFIQSYVPYERKEKDSLFRLIDEYSLFYLAWIRPNRRQIAQLATDNYWPHLQQTASWRSWAGYTFESLCLKHARNIIQALGISGIITQVMPWRYQPVSKEERGAQIDMLIDRGDRTVNICEMKYCEGPFTVTASIRQDLQDKIQVFKEQTRSRKTVFLTFVTTFGCKKNRHYTSIVNHDLTMDCLFEMK